MPLSEYIEQLRSVTETLKEAGKELGVFTQIDHCFLDGCGEYWKLRFWKTTGQKMAGDDYYYRDFDTIEQLVEHLQLLVLGAKIARGEEV